MKALVLGTGATGSRAARQLLSGSEVEKLTLVDDNIEIAEDVAASLGDPATAMTISSIRLESRLERFGEACSDMDVVILTAPSDNHVDFAETALRAGAHVVSVSDDLNAVQDMMAVDEMAKQLKRSLVIGAGFAPGLTDLLARHAAAQLDVVDEIHIAKSGTGGPECARQHHKALRADGLDWRNQQWEKRHGGSGRELCWFPDPVGGLDCYEAALPDPLLLHAAFPAVVRASARVSATRRDRSTKWVPMMRKPHPEGMIGAVRVEVRGWIGNIRSAVILGVLDRPAVAAGTMAALVSNWAVAGRLSRVGSGGVAEMIPNTVEMLTELAERGVKAAAFEGGLSDQVR